MLSTFRLINDPLALVQCSTMWRVVSLAREGSNTNRGRGNPGRARDVVKKMLSRKVHGMVRGEYNTGSSEPAREAARLCPGYGKGATIDMRRTVQWSL